MKPWALLALVGLAIILGASLIFGISHWLALTPTEEIPAKNLNEQSSSEPSAKTAWLDWRGGAVNNSVGTLQAGSRLTRPVYIGPGGKVAFVVKTLGGKPTVTLKTPTGEIITPASASAQYQVQTNPRTGETTTTYTVTDNQDSGQWQILLENDSPADSDYQIETPGANPPLIITTETQGTTTDDGGGSGGITLSLTVGETTSDLVFRTISGATVTAVITSPSGQVFVIILTEDPNEPGTYRGVFNGDLESGVYHIEYIITGTDSEGNPFTQITSDNFTVTSDSGGSNPPSGWNKKYDINRGDEVNIIGY